MALKKMVLELGMGTDIRGEDYTKAACRALHAALRQNSLSVADAFGKSPNDMHVKVTIGVQNPDRVDTSAVSEILPYGIPEIHVVFGGMDTLAEDGSRSVVMANAALAVYLDLDDEILEGAA